MVVEAPHQGARPGPPTSTALRMAPDLAKVLTEAAAAALFHIVSGAHQVKLQAADSSKSLMTKWTPKVLSCPQGLLLEDPPLSELFNGSSCLRLAAQYSWDSSCALEIGAGAGPGTWPGLFSLLDCDCTPRVAVSFSVWEVSATRGLKRKRRKRMTPQKMKRNIGRKKEFRMLNVHRKFLLVILLANELEVNIVDSQDPPSHKRTFFYCFLTTKNQVFTNHRPSHHPLPKCRLLAFLSGGSSGLCAGCPGGPSAPLWICADPFSSSSCLFPSPS